MAAAAEREVLLVYYRHGSVQLWKTDLRDGVATALAMEMEDNIGTCWIAGADASEVAAVRDELEAERRRRDDEWVRDMASRTFYTLWFEIAGADGNVHRGTVQVEDPDEWIRDMAKFGVTVYRREIR